MKKIYISPFNKGFTLIELLVVIAIIGILAAIVLATLGTARTKGSDAKIQGLLHSIQTQAEILYGNSSNAYGTADPASVNCPATAGSLPGDPQIVTILAGMPAGTTVKCGVTTTTHTHYAVAASLSGTGAAGDYWCVDDTAPQAQKINITTIANVAVTDDTCAKMDAR
jgi:prepilin-type N-terminal cleavage/methylation domain-containing protein